MKKQNAQAYVFLSPFILLVSVFYIVPAILTVVMAFTSLDSSFVWKFNGIKNFILIAKDPNTGIIIRNTVLFVSLSIALFIIIDLFLAVMTTYFIKSTRWSSFFKSLIMIPMITPAVVYSVLWIWLLEASDQGLINQIYSTFLKDSQVVNWIAQYPFQIIVIATVMSGMAYGTTVFASAIKSIPENQFKAAMVDGASEWEIIKSIILPNISYHIKFIALWEVLGLLTDYVTILLITNGGPTNKTEVWALSAYHKAFVGQQYGYGAAISLVLILVVLLLMILLSRLMKRQAKT